MPRPTQAIIDLSALSHNLSIVRRSLPASTTLWAVVKADAYGHGLRHAIEALHDADGFAMIEIDSAVALRRSGVDKSILLLEGPFDANDCRTIIEHRLTPVVARVQQIDWLEASLAGRSIPVYVKYNTGMNRLGFNDSTVVGALERLETLGWPVTLMTHFANADGPLGIETPMAKIDAVVAHFPTLPCCLGNSATIFRYPVAHRQAVRAGIALYGASPFVDVDATLLDLRPAMTLTSRLIAAQSVEPGESVGYGSRFIVDRPMRIGIAAIGYGDGYPRSAPDGTPVLVDDRICPLVGRVSMDMLCVDLTDHPTADVGSRVTLWGDGLPADKVARHVGTIAYELFCQVTARVPFHYRRSEAD